MTPDVCKQYDKHFPMTKAEVEQFVAWYESGQKVPANYTVPDDIKNWPGNGDVTKGQCFYLAPYVSTDCSGGAYDYNNGDYPYYDFTNELCNIKGKIAGLGCTEQPIYYDYSASSKCIIFLHIIIIIIIATWQTKC